MDGIHPASGYAPAGGPYYTLAPYPSPTSAASPSTSSATSTYVYAASAGSSNCASSRPSFRRRYPGGFVLGLHLFISKCSAPGGVKVVAWSGDGKHFVVLDIAAFMEQQDICDSSEWPTFHRQLLAYGFKKINHAARGHDANTDQPAFRHPSFHRDSTHEYLKRSKEKWKEEGDPDHLRPDGRVPVGAQSPTPAELQLAEHVSQLQQHAHAMSAKYDAVLARIEALEKDHRGISKLVHSLLDHFRARGQRQMPANNAGQPYPNATQSTAFTSPSSSVPPPFVPPIHNANHSGFGLLALPFNPASAYGVPGNVLPGMARVMNDGLAPVQRFEGPGDGAAFNHQQ